MEQKSSEMRPFCAQIVQSRTIGLHVASFKVKEEVIESRHKIWGKRKKTDRTSTIDGPAMR
jgi:hypothetical protein